MPSDPAVWLSQQDREVLRSAVDDVKKLLRNVANRPGVDAYDLLTAPEVYVGLSPTGGIPARSGTTPGNTYCQIYQILDDGTTFTLAQMYDLDERVFNLSPTDIPSGEWLILTRDKGGRFLVQAVAVDPISSSITLRLVTNLCIVSECFSGNPTVDYTKPSLGSQIPTIALDDSFTLSETKGTGIATLTVELDGNGAVTPGQTYIVLFLVSGQSLATPDLILYWTPSSSADHGTVSGTCRTHRLSTGNNAVQVYIQSTAPTLGTVVVRSAGTVWTVKPDDSWKRETNSVTIPGGSRTLLPCDTNPNDSGDCPCIGGSSGGGTGTSTGTGTNGCAVLTFSETSGEGVFQSIITVSGVSLSSTDALVVHFGWVDDADHTPTVTWNGHSMALAVTSSLSVLHGQTWVYFPLTGGTGDVVISDLLPFAKYTFAVVKVSGLPSRVLGDTNENSGSGTDTDSGSLTVAQACSCVLSAAFTRGPQSDTHGTWQSPFTGVQNNGTTGSTDSSNVYVEEARYTALTAGAVTAQKSGQTSRPWVQTGVVLQ